MFVCMYVCKYVCMYVGRYLVHCLNAVSPWLKGDP